MLAYAESSPSSYLLNHLAEAHMNSYRSAVDDLDHYKSSYARSPSFDSTFSRRYSNATSIPISTARPVQYSSGSYDKYSNSYDSSTINRRSSGKPPLPTYYSGLSSSKYSSAANSPDVRTSYRYDRAASSDRNSSGGGDSYRSAVSHVSRLDDDFRRIPSTQVNNIARKFENLCNFDHRDTFGRSSSRRDRSYDYTYGGTNGVSSSLARYGTSNRSGLYDEESRDTLAALPHAANNTLYRSRIGALSVPDVPSYAKNQVRRELEDDDDDDEEEYLERRTVGAYISSPASTSSQRKVTPVHTPTSGSSGLGSSASSSPASFSRTEPTRGSVSSLESSESRRSNDNLIVRSVRSAGDDASARTGLLGLRNLGNTCFMNSVIQCLSHTRLLREYCLQTSNVHSDINNSSRMKGALMKAFCETISDLWTSCKSAHVNPDKFKMQIQKFAPRFTGYNQQDAQEFLRYLLQGMHEDINRVQTKTPPLPPLDDNLNDQQKACESWKRYLRIDDSKIVDYFVGQLKSELKCTHCGHVSTTFDPFWDLSLPIPQERRNAGQVSLYDCMDFFAKEEIMDGDEKPTCESCKTRRRCTKKFLIQKFPTILVLHLKRFSGERYRSRLSTLVDFPTSKFDLTPYAASKQGSSTPKYELYAVSNHSGTPMMGHYTAYCKHSTNGQWYLFDDSRVTAVNENSVVSGEAYVLFYELTSNGSSTTCTRL